MRASLDALTSCIDHLKQQQQHQQHQGEGSSAESEGPALLATATASMAKAAELCDSNRAALLQAEEAAASQAVDLFCAVEAAKGEAEEKHQRERAHWEDQLSALHSALQRSIAGRGGEWQDKAQLAANYEAKCALIELLQDRGGGVTIQAAPLAALAVAAVAAGKPPLFCL